MPLRGTSPVAWLRRQTSPRMKGGSCALRRRIARPPAEEEDDNWLTDTTSTIGGESLNRPRTAAPRRDGRDHRGMNGRLGHLRSRQSCRTTSTTRAWSRLGVAFTAWTLGARHAFDADHISAIDNTTRKLMADGKRPLGTGFFFALGHSSIIVVVGAGIAVAAKAVFGAVVDPNSGYETAGGVIGTSLAATFLYLIAALNLVVLAGIVKVFRDMRRGVYDEEELERQLQARGLMYRFFGRWMRSITKTWHMFFVGLVFGIGFDTATEVLLLAATAAAATQGLPWYAVLALPLLFAGGMTLFDTSDGCS